MKKIIVPIDFSETSLSALKTGIVIANKLNAELRIVYVDPTGHHARGFEILDDDNKSDAQKLLDNLLLENRQAYYVSGGKMDYKIRSGIVADEIIGQSKYDDAAMIVMGSHGVSGITKSWIGGNAYRVICNAPCPVLVIREDMKYDSNFSRIVVPIEMNKSSRYKIPVVGGVCKLFKAKVTLIGIRRSGIASILQRITNNVHQVEKFLTSYGIEVAKTTVISGNDANEKFLEAVQCEDADMITLDVTNMGNFLMDRFQPFLISLVNNAKCPVLAIPIKA